MPLVKPEPFTRNSRVGLIMPASQPHVPGSREEGIRVLRERGLEIVDPLPEFAQQAYLAGEDSERADHFNSFLVRTDLSTLLCIRGGFGAMRILEDIDYEAARNHSKMIIGYSDITALHCALYTQAGWPSIAGPMVAVDWPSIDADSENQFWQLCAGDVLTSLSLPGDPLLNPIREGEAEGVLIGGNLAGLVRLLATPYFPSLKNAILFLEDIGEAPYRVDAMLSQLKLAGKLDHLAGVALGSFADCEPDPGKPSFTTREVLHQYFSRLSCPVVEGLNFGHQPRKVSMPFGVQAKLTVSSAGGILSMLEPVVASRHESSMVRKD